MREIDLTKSEDQRRDYRERIRRLRQRLTGPRPDLVAVIKGLLDLLEDEL